MTPSVKLKVLVSLEPFVAYFAYESVRRHEGLRRESNDLGIWIWCSWKVSLLLGRGIRFRVRVCVLLLSEGSNGSGKGKGITGHHLHIRKGEKLVYWKGVVKQ